MKKIKVLFLTDQLVGDGSQRLTADLAGGLDPQRFETGVCALTRGGILEAELAAKGIPYWILNKRLGMDFSVLPKAVRLLKSWKADVAHTFRFTANSFGRAAAILARVPVIIGTEHTFEFRSKPRILIDRFLTRFTQRTIVVTRESQRQVIDDFGIDPAKVMLIDEGIDFSEFKPRQDALAPGGLRPDQEIVVGIVARLQPQKAHHRFIQAMTRVMATYPNLKAWIVGEGFLRPQLEAQVQRTPYAARFQFLGYRPDLAALLPQLHLFVMSSDWEGLPIALLDAVACRVPFVVTAVGGIPEVFADRVHGRLVPAGDDAKLAQAIVESLANYPPALEMAERARQSILKKFSQQRMIQEHEQLYTSLLALP